MLEFTPLHFRRALLLLSFLACTFAFAQIQTEPELNTIVMESTFKIEGPGSLGTAFLLGRPYAKDSTRLRLVLVTAGHVLEQVNGETAILSMRRKTGPTSWEVLPVPLKIRDGDRRLWTKHPEADVAVMYIGLPEQVVQEVLPTTLLADDTRLAEYEIHPGDELMCVGFPLGLASNRFQFPVLRSGKIASYPLLPTKKTKSFLLDLRMFPGNSGGPVYFVESLRVLGGRARQGYFALVMGLVSKEVRWSRQLEELYGRREEVHPLGLAEVVHASLILETVNLLPPAENR